MRPGFLNSRTGEAHLAEKRKALYHSHMTTNVRINSSDCTPPADTCNIPCFDGQLVRQLKAKLPDSESLQDAGRLFGALSDPTRLKLLVALGQGDELCVCDLAHVAGTTISTASHHLRKLRDLGVLKHRNDGRMAYYTIRNHRVAQLASIMFSSEEASR